MCHHLFCSVLFYQTINHSTAPTHHLQLVIALLIFVHYHNKIVLIILFWGSLIGQKANVTAP